jgi:hypothetical protein
MSAALASASAAVWAFWASARRSCSATRHRVQYRPQKWRVVSQQAAHTLVARA